MLENQNLYNLYKEYAGSLGNQLCALLTVDDTKVVITKLKKRKALGSACVSTEHVSHIGY